MVPHAGSAGRPVNFVLLSWLYALYSFDYKWSLTSRRLEQRVLFFEHHWAFFSGRATPCLDAGWGVHAPSCGVHTDMTMCWSLLQCLGWGQWLSMLSALTWTCNIYRSSYVLQ